MMAFGTEEKHHALIDVHAKIIEPVFYDTPEMPFHICGMSDEMPYDSTIYSEMSEEEIDILLKNFREKLEKMKTEFDPDIVISHHSPDRLGSRSF